MSVYRVTEVIGVSEQSWEDAAREAVNTAAAEMYHAATGLARQFISGPALALRAAKQAIDTGLDGGLDAGLEIERLHFAALFATEDQKLGMESFVASGPGKAEFTGK